MHNDGNLFLYIPKMFWLVCKTNVFAFYTDNLADFFGRPIFVTFYECQFWTKQINLKFLCNLYWWWHLLKVGDAIANDMFFLSIFFKRNLTFLIVYLLWITYYWDFFQISFQFISTLKSSSIKLNHDILLVVTLVLDNINE